MMKSNAYYRARIQTFNEHIQSATNQEKKWLQNGFVQESDKDDFEMWINGRVHNQSNEPLTFTELTTYNTWYAMHPEKIAGKMQGGTSMFFPVVVKGTRQDVENLFKQAMIAENQSDATEDEDSLKQKLNILRKYFKGKRKVRINQHPPEIGNSPIHAYSYPTGTMYADVRFEQFSEGNGWDYLNVCFVFNDPNYSGGITVYCDALPEYDKLIKTKKSSINSTNNELEVLELEAEAEIELIKL